MANYKLNPNIIINEPIKLKNSIPCENCKDSKTPSSFIKMYTELGEPNKYIPYCKKCLRLLCNNSQKQMDIKLSIPILKKLNIPFKRKIWEDTLRSSAKTEEHIISYIKKMASMTYSKLSWKDSDLNYLIHENHIEKEQDSNFEQNSAPVEIVSGFEVTNKMLELFGNGFTKDEYREMWSKYNFLNKNYTEQTSMHTEALVTYIRYKVKEEMSIAKGDAQEAKTWGELAMKQADKAKINPYQLSKADLQGGLTTIGEIVQAVEQNLDIIPILPKFKFRPNDAVDFCIWNYINYARNLEGKPLIEYDEVYKFYDVQKQNYIDTTGDPYGIFENDSTEKNRDKIQTFIKPLEEEN